MRLSDDLKPLWALFDKSGGSLRVIAAAAELCGLVSSPSLPLPLMAVSGAEREQLALLLHELNLV